MSVGDNVPNHLQVVRLNADLRSAQLDLLSAQCATDRLRLGFAPEEVARLGDRELLRKAANAAKSLHEFYRTIEKAVHSLEAASAESNVRQAP